VSTKSKVKEKKVEGPFSVDPDVEKLEGRKKLNRYTQTQRVTTPLKVNLWRKSKPESVRNIPHEGRGGKTSRGKRAKVAGGENHIKEVTSQVKARRGYEAVIEGRWAWSENLDSPGGKNWEERQCRGGGEKQKKKPRQLDDEISKQDQRDIR